MTEKYYKWTAPGGQAPFANGYRYPLPVKNGDGTWTPGEWTQPAQGDLIPCTNGYHVCRPTDLVNWINAELYECEIDGDQIACDDPEDSKLCVRRIRLTRRVEGWNERTARLFAVWCSRQVLALIPDPDPRSVAAVDTTERFATGRATAGELAAARDAAGAAAGAAWDAAGAVARAVARAAAEDEAGDVAWAADWGASGAVARAVAGDVARAVAGDVAWAAARDVTWEVARAAARAAGDAAWDVARAAGAAGGSVWDVARAAGDAARAAGDAARAAQNAKLLEMIEEVSHD